MNVTSLAFWLFIAVASTALYVLMAIPEAHVRRPGGDAAHVAAGHVRAALATGNAAAALHRLMAAPEECQDAPELAFARRVLQAELAPVRVRDVPAPLGSPTVLANLSPAALVDLLRDRIDDARVAAATERLFASAGGWAAAVPEVAPDGVAVRLGSAATEPSGAEPVLALAAAFRQQGRARAWQRWLLRAVAAAPQALAPRLELCRLLVAEQRLAEALAVVSLPDAHVGSGALALAWWRQRGELGRWLGEWAVEMAALERRIELEPEPELLQRLVAVCLAHGEPRRAVHHAAARARATGSADDLIAAAQLALQWGDLDAGIALLREVPPGPQQRAARQRLAELLEQDLRLGEALDVRVLLCAAGGDADSEQAREDLLRRLGRHGELADVLFARFRAAPADLDLGEELLHLLAALDRDAQAEAVLGHLAATLRRPQEFFTVLAMIARRGGAFVAARAGAMAEDPALLAADAPLVLAALHAARPYGDFPAVQDALVRRFGEQPAVVAGLLALADAQASAAERAAAVGRLAQAHPERAELWQAWVTRLAWAGDDAGLLAARQRAFRDRPEDQDNRAHLATLLVVQRRVADAAAVLGLELLPAPAGSPAVQVARALAAAPGSGPLQWRAAADQLLAAAEPAAAALLYDAILSAEPDDAHALRQSGLALAWAGQPGAAVERLQRVLLREPGDADLHFALADALVAVAQPELARRHQRIALAAYEAMATPTLTARQRRALLLFRLGRFHAAEVACRELILDVPGDPVASAQLVSLLLRDGRLAQAEAVLADAARLAPGAVEVLHMRSHLLAARGEFAAAAAVLQQIPAEGDGGGLLADIGRLQERGGELDAALASYRRWAALRPGDEPAAAVQRVGDRKGRMVGAAADYRAVGDDRAVEGGLIGALPLGERTRAHYRLAAAEYRGRAAAFAGGTADAVTTTPLFDVSAAWRHGNDDDQFGAGVMLAPDAPGGGDVGLWVGGHWLTPEPFRSLEVRAHFDQLWTDPVAAAALGGRSHGIDVRGHHSLGASAFASVSAGYRRLRLQPPDGSHPDDDEWTAEFAVGSVLREGRVAVADRFRPRMAPAGPNSPFLDRECGSGPQLASWLGFHPTRLTGNAELAQLLPLSSRTDLAFVAGSVDQQLARHLGARLEGFYGRELHAETASFGVQAGCTWRPAPMFECTLGAGFGRTAGRGSADDDAVQAHFEILLRW